MIIHIDKDGLFGWVNDSFDSKVIGFPGCLHHFIDSVFIAHVSKYDFYGYWMILK